MFRQLRWKLLYAANKCHTDDRNNNHESGRDGEKERPLAALTCCHDSEDS